MKSTILSIFSLAKARRLALLLIALLLAGVLGSTAARADHRAVLGAIIGGTTGALVGDSMGGRDGAIVGGALGAVAGAALTQAHYRPDVGYVPPPPYYRPPHVVVPAPVYYPSYERDWERRHWERRHRQEERRHERDRDWDRDGYRR